MLATILKTVFLAKKYQFILLVRQGLKLGYNGTSEFVWFSSSPNTIAPWKRSHGTIYLFMYNIRCLILSFIYILSVYLVALWLPHLKGIQFSRTTVMSILSLSLPTYMCIRSSYVRSSWIMIQKTLCMMHWGKFSLITYIHAIFDDSVTVIEWNLTKAGRLVGLASCGCGCGCGCGYSTSRHCNNFIGCKPHSRTSVTFCNYKPWK